MQLQKFVFIIIQDDNHGKENIEEEKIYREDTFRRRRLLARIRRDTAKKKRITKRSSGKMGNAARRSNDLNYITSNSRI